MDPNAALANMRTLIREASIAVDENRLASSDAIVTELVDQWEALDNWLKGGGFRPAAWERPYRNS